MKIYKLLLFIFLPFSIFAEPIDKYILENFFAQEYTSSNPTCMPECRELRFKDKFITKIIDFDATTGITTCEVFPFSSGDNELTKLSIDANSQNLTCVEKYNTMQIDYLSSNLKSKL